MATKRLKLKRTEQNEKQLNIFDASGAPHADMHCGMTLDKHARSRATLEGMKFVFVPTIRPGRAFIVLETLRLLRTDKSRPWVVADWSDEPAVVEVWPETVFVDFRKYDSNDDGTVRLSRRKNRIHLSLPNASSWSDCGLGWVYSHLNCEKEMTNPTPWFGRICDCPPPIVKKKPVPR
jgi:hypothetical protein